MVGPRPVDAKLEDDGVLELAVGSHNSIKAMLQNLTAPWDAFLHCALGSIERSILIDWGQISHPRALDWANVSQACLGLLPGRCSDMHL